MKLDRLDRFEVFTYFGIVVVLMVAMGTFWTIIQGPARWAFMALFGGLAVYFIRELYLHFKSEVEENDRQNQNRVTKWPDHYNW